MRVIELEKNMKHGYLPYTEKDIRNLFVKAIKKTEGSDVMDLLKYCEDAKQTSSKFQYAYTLDEERRLEHIFWSSASCFDWSKNTVMLLYLILHTRSILMKCHLGFLWV